MIILVHSSTISTVSYSTRCSVLTSAVHCSQSLYGKVSFSWLLPPRWRLRD